MRVRIYVEGGGDHNKALQTECRRGFSEFVRKAGLEGRMPRIVACGSRQNAFETFCTAHNSKTGETAVLLVDSEAAVSAADSWAHVLQRPSDRWQVPNGETADQLHLMVQAMEAWFYADKDALTDFFGAEFKADNLSGRTNIEEIPKRDLFEGLEQASRDCRGYSKGADSFKILARIDPARVLAASGFARRFIQTLDKLC